MSEQSSGFQHLSSGDPTPVLPVGAPSPRRPVTWRSVLVGLAGVLLICGLTPYNDFVMGNTYLVGNFMPIGLLLFFMLILMLVNAPLHLWLPKQALSSGELAVALGMVLISSTLPSSGLMRYLPTTLVGMNYHVSTGGERLTTLEHLDLPQWMFPTRPGETVREQAGSNIIRDYYGRSSEVAGAPTMGEAIAAVPWSAWVTPAITWGILLIGLYGAIICLMVIVRRQWAENERLAFPLATVYSSLIESPAPGRALSPLFLSFGFWVSFAVVFVLHSFNAMHKYDPQIWPEIPLNFDLNSLFQEEPWRYMHWSSKSASLYFVIIGFTYFLQTNVAFSLWFVYLLSQVVRMQMGMMQSEITGGMEQDQSLGATLVFALAVIWIGRQHWWLVMRQMVRPPKNDEPTGRYLPYFLAGWGLVGCVVLMVIWLMAAGTSMIGGVVIVLMVLTFLMVVARVVAETGLIFVQINVPLIRPLIYALNDVPQAMQMHRPLNDYFFIKLFERLFTHDMREAVAPYAINALRVADLQAYEGEKRWTRAIPFTLCLLAALAFGYVVSGASMIYTEYAHASTLGVPESTPINAYAVDSSANDILDRTREFENGGTGPKENHNRLLNFGSGATVTAGLSALRLRYVSWPIHPVGFLLVYSYPMYKIWFSVLLGWLAKVLLVKYGGSTVYRAAKPYFIGLIVGEATVAAFWLLVGFIRNAQNLPFEAINLLPG